MRGRDGENLRRWHARQAELRYVDLTPVMTRVEALRAEGVYMTDIVTVVNTEGFTTRLGEPWTYPSLTQAFYRWRRTTAAAA